MENGKEFKQWDSFFHYDNENNVCFSFGDSESNVMLSNIGFYGAFTNNNDISICMEFMDGLSLDIVLQTAGPINEKRVGRIAVAVIKGLTYLKDEFNILHRGL